MNPTSADQISPLEMFKISIGPSSSHTMGPMLAALQFRGKLIDYFAEQKSVSESFNVEVELYGSLSATGKGHMTDGAVCAGLAGLNLSSDSPEEIWATMPKMKSQKIIEIAGKTISFDPEKDIKWLGWFIDGEGLPHPNTIRFCLFADKKPLFTLVMLSVGGGFVEDVDPSTGMRRAPNTVTKYSLPYPYNSMEEFIKVCEKTKLPSWQIVVENQKAKGLTEQELRNGLKKILQTFNQCIDQGLKTEGILPGGLNVRRRAKALYTKFKAGKTNAWSGGGDWRPSVYAMAVNEENAAGSRVVTAPTNGSSGLIPAVWRTLSETNNLSETTMVNGLIVASIIGALVKTHASISGAEVGCQGEVGTSCAMAGGGAVAMLGGNIRQIEQAAEMGIEHHLGMTCDPINGLVQIPCIERNAMGAVEALNAANLALAGDGEHLVSLDKSLAVMKQTGLDMNQKYKETATGGLALG